MDQLLADEQVFGFGGSQTLYPLGDHLNTIHDLALGFIGSDTRITFNKVFRFFIPQMGQ